VSSTDLQTSTAETPFRMPVKPGVVLKHTYLIGFHDFQCIRKIKGYNSGLFVYCALLKVSVVFSYRNPSQVAVDWLNVIDR
jgi:hypothetical protein